MIEKLTRVWKESVAKFTGNPLDFDFKHVVLTNLREKRSDVFSHYIHPYPAKMFPYIPMFLFSIPELCPLEGIVLDPFCGSGTVLLESIIHPVYKRNIFGTELNPLARLIAKVKTTPLNEHELRKRIDHLFELAAECDPKRILIPESEKINFWFSKKAICRLGRIRFLIEQEGENDDYKDFFWVCFSSVIRKVSKADPFIPPPVLLKIHKYEKSPKKFRFLKMFIKQTTDPDVMSKLRNVVEKNYLRIRQLNKIPEVRERQIMAHVIWDDVRNMKIGKLLGKGTINKVDAKALPPRSIDFIITSPPYLTAQKYIRTQRLELLWLGFSENYISDIQKRLIGTERISMRADAFSLNIGIDTIDSLVEWCSFSPHRASELAHYFYGMRQAVLEMNRVLKLGAYAVVVLGNNKVLGMNLETHKCVIDIASASGFSLEVILKDKIRGRGMITGRHSTGGLIEEEFIIVLKKVAENVRNN